MSSARSYTTIRFEVSLLKNVNFVKNHRHRDLCLLYESQCLGRILGMKGPDSSVSKSNRRLHVLNIQYHLFGFSSIV